MNPFWCIASSSVKLEIPCLSVDCDTAGVFKHVNLEILGIRPDLNLYGQPNYSIYHYAACFYCLEAFSSV